MIARLRAVLPGAPEFRSMARSPRKDLLAGLTVAIVALPLALGFGVASGLGASAGLVTAIIAGAVAAVCGGSDLQVSGPTGAMTVVLVPIVGKYGTNGVLAVGLIAGVLLLLLAVMRAGSLVRFVPLPVVEGFTLGIAVVIGLQQVPAALGVAKPEGENTAVVAARAVAAAIAHPRWWSIGLALGVAAIMLIGAHLLPRVPFSLIAVVVAALAALAFTLPVDLIGELPRSLPAPTLSFLDVGTIPALLPSAVAVAALAALESLLSATVADGMSGRTKHDPDRELFGQGLANLAAPLFGGVPATAAIARTAVNVRSGAVSRLAALAHAGFLAVVVFAAAPLVARIPLAALAGVLLATAIRMIQIRALAHLARSGHGEAALLAVTAVATVAVDLVWAVVAGLVLAGFLALREVARSARLERLSHDDPGVVVYRLHGPLLFAAAHRFLPEPPEGTGTVLLRMSRVTAVDATGAGVLAEAVRRMQDAGVTVLMSGLRDDHRRPLAGVIERLGGAVHPDQSSALAAAGTPR